MDFDIQFGEVEQVGTETRRRPDRNRHFAVAAVGSPDDDDLHIYVDLDVMMDMEAHALSDTSVELGGVMLGGQYEDEEGEPFVVVTDALRAKHYENTKGSFKFTHDTWSEITRQRDEFPEDLQMVGWYHTHPDWGVFLSGMDTFICKNFFNRPSDVALVIDPCSDDRGFFQWADDAGQSPQRTGGFSLIASRFRRRELEHFVAHLEGKYAMTTDPSSRGYPGYAGLPPAPVVNIAEQRPGWLGAAVLGTLAVQVCLTLLIAWRLINPAPVPVADPPTQEKPSQEIAALNERIDHLVRAQRESERLAAQREVLDEVIGSVEIAPDGLVQSLVTQREDNERLRAAVGGYALLEDENERLKKVSASLATTAEDQTAQIDHLRDEVADLRKQHLKEITALNKELDELKKEDPSPKTLDDVTEKKEADTEEEEEPSAILMAAVIGGIVVVVAAILGLVVLMFFRKKPEDDDPKEGA